MQHSSKCCKRRRNALKNCETRTKIDSIVVQTATDSTAPAAETPAAAEVAPTTGGATATVTYLHSAEPPQVSVAGEATTAPPAAAYEARGTTCEEPAPEVATAIAARHEPASEGPADSAEQAPTGEVEGGRGQLAGGDTWDLIELSAVPPPPAFPLDVLPTELARYVVGVGAMVNCPPDYAAVPLLALAGAAIGATRALEIKAGHAERPALYAAVIGRPSSGKTPAQNNVAQPVRDAQSRHHEAFRRARQAQQGAADGADEPVERILYVDDITVEKLAVVLQQNPRGVAVIKDELTGWVRAMDAHRGGKGADKQHWLSAWSGGQITVRRKTERDGPGFVPHAFVAVVGGLPPDMLSAVRGGSAADGFMDRILFSYPDPLGAAAEDWSSISDEAADAWRRVLSFLWSIEADCEPAGGTRPRLAAVKVLLP
jgi:hypothetical protein